MKKFNTDSHFVIGHLHIRQNKPCQDHALNGIKDEGSAGMICVSDGCSSGGHTDIGSRVITLSTVRAIQDRNLRVPVSEYMQSLMIASIGTYSLLSRVSLAITNEDMLATSLYAVMNEHGGYIHMLGDGVCAIKSKDGIVAVVALDWQQNTPYYPIYREDNIDQFIALHKKFDNGEKALRITTYKLLPSGEEQDRSETYYSIDEAINGFVVKISKEEVDNIESIAVFSDGVQDFQSLDGKQVKSSQVVHEMMSFKNYTGEFVKRRVSAALKAFGKNGINPNDDFSMAAIHFNDQTEEAI